MRSGWPAGEKFSAAQSTAIWRLPTPRKPPKSMIAARVVPALSTMTSTIRPIASPLGLTTGLPRMACALSFGSTAAPAGTGAAFAASACGKPRVPPSATISQPTTKTTTATTMACRTGRISGSLPDDRARWRIAAQRTESLAKDAVTNGDFCVSRRRHCRGFATLAVPVAQLFEDALQVVPLVGFAQPDRAAGRRLGGRPAAGENHLQRRFSLPRLADELVAVLAWQPDVGEQHVDGIVIVENPQRRVGVGGFDDLMAEIDDIADRRFADQLVIFDDEHAQRVRHCVVCRLRTTGLGAWHDCRQ